MPIRVDRPLGAPDWVEWFAQKLEQLIDRLDRANVHILRRDITKADAGSTISLGAIPPSAMILKAMSGVVVHEVFNAGTNNRLDVGTAADTDLFGTDLSLTALGFVPLDENVAGYRNDSLTDWVEIKTVVDVSGTAATTGKASVIIAYVELPEAA